MEFDFDSDRTEAFIAAALTHHMLTEEQAATLRSESTQRSMSPAHLAIESGILKPIDAEIALAFAAPHDLAPGYELLDVLGHGALGVVYRAHQPHLKRDVAIKSILQNRLVEQNVVARFQQEGAAIGQLQHPNIVSAFDSGSHNRRLFLVMELVRGTDLRERLDSKGAMDLTTALSILRQTASGLAHALAHQIIHRDIKPGNLILTEAPAGFDLPPGVPLVKIADFGLARLSTPVDSDDTRLTMTGSAVGTPMYCAPEQLSGDEVDHRADIYALGATLVNMLTGKPPYRESKLSKLITAKLTGQKYDEDQLPADLPEEVRGLIDRMTAHDPNDRIDSYQTLIEEIDLIQPASVPSSSNSGRFVRPAGGSVVSPPQQRGWSRRWVGGALAAIVLVVAAGLLLPVVWPQLFSDPKPTLIHTRWQQELFENLSQWASRGGGWNVENDAEGAPILALQGSASTSLPKPPGPDAGIESAVAMSVAAELLEADAVEVHFGFDRDDVEQAERFVLRYDHDQVVVGKQQGLQGEWKSLSEPAEAPEFGDPDVPMRYEMRIELHDKYWFAYFNSDLVGFVQADPDAPNNLVQLVARGGKAQVADAMVLGLQRPDTITQG